MILKNPKVVVSTLLSCVLAMPTALWAETISDQNNPAGAKPASDLTIKKNAKVFGELDFKNTEEYAVAAKGLVASSVNNPDILNVKREIIWEFTGFDFEGTKPVTTAKEYAAYSVNPSLWRQAQLNNNQGLFKVTVDRSDQAANIYQIRGFDIANMTIIEANSGIIVLDTLTSKETAAAAIKFYNDNRGRQHYTIQDASQNAPIVAVIYSHSHIDHFGGAEGVVKAKDVQNLDAEQIKTNAGDDTLTLSYVKDKSYVIAPSGFMNAAISEDVYAGNAMGRRSEYMYGSPLLGGKQDFRGGGEKGHVDAGLGKALSSGTTGVVAPSVIVNKDKTLVVDGVTIAFQLTPNTEAPAEMTSYFKDFKALDMGEIACPLMHNLLSLRGTAVRDALSWTNYLTQSLDRYGAEVDVMLGQHNWPRWGNQAINEVLTKQRDSYKYIHDQTLRLTNQGYTMNELAEMVVMPDSLKAAWYNQGYYGALKHNVKAVYQRYIGWYDANPANLDPLSDKAASEKYIEYMGGLPAVLAKAEKDFEKGNYRWVAQVMNHAVFAFPDNKPAGALQANALEQLGYQSENATWRNAYLMGANELRNGIASSDVQTENQVATSFAGSLSSFTAMTLPMILDYSAIKLNGPKANGKHIAINWLIECPEKTATSQINNEVTQYQADMCGNYAMTVENSTLVYLPQNLYPSLYEKASGNADAINLTLTRNEFNALMLEQTALSSKKPAHASAKESLLEDLAKRGKIQPNGKAATVHEFFALLDVFAPDFPIVLPQGFKTKLSERNE